MKWEDQTTKLQSLTIIKGTVGVINENNLYNKTRHSYIYIYMLPIAGQTAGPDWAEIFLWTLTGGVIGKKKQTTGLKFRKLLTKICKIFCNFKMLLQPIIYEKCIINDLHIS